MLQLLLHILGSYTVFQGLSLLVLSPLSTITEHLYYAKLKNEGYIREEENLTLKEEIEEDINFYLSLFLKPGMPLVYDLLFIFAPNYILKAMKEKELKIGIIKKIENESTNKKEANESLGENISITNEDNRYDKGLTEEQKAWFDREWDKWYKYEFESGKTFERITSREESTQKKQDTGFSYLLKKKQNNKQ